MADFDSRTNARILTGALAVSLALLCCQEALAVPMKCSWRANHVHRELQKESRTFLPSICVTNCGARQSICMRTGCWDSGVQKYCGLEKQ
jgi:hypothetical protein